MNNIFISTDTKIGTVSGTLLVIVFGVLAGEIFKACVLAATGAFVSFSMSLFCKWVWDKIQKRRQRF